MINIEDKNGEISNGLLSWGGRAGDFGQHCYAPANLYKLCLISKSMEALVSITPNFNETWCNWISVLYFYYLFIILITN